MNVLLGNRLFIPRHDVTADMLSRYTINWTQYYTDSKIGDDGLVVLDNAGKPKLERKEIQHTIVGTRSILSGIGQDYIGFPRGNCTNLYEFVRKAIDVRSVCPLSFRFKMNKATLADDRWNTYQKQCVDKFLKKGSGIIIAKTGSGKTVMGIATAVRLGLRTLVLAARKDVEPHWVPEFRKHTNIDKIEKKLNRKIIGKYDPNKDKQPDIAVSTIQTFLHKSGYESLIRHQNHFGFIICDEIHELVSQEFFRVLSLWNPLSWLGLTATIKRNDRREQLALWHLGGIVAEAEVDQMRPQVTFIKDGFVVPSWLDGRTPYSRQWKWNKLHQLLEQDEYRNDLIVKKVMEDIDNGRLVAVVGLRLSIVKKIRDRLRQEGYKVAYVDGKVKKAKRDEIYKEVAKGKKYRCICAGKVLKAMVSIDPLDCMHLVTPVNDEITMQQFFGRTRRPQEGKPFPLIRVYVSEGGQLSGAAKNLKRYCNKEGWDIEEEDSRRMAMKTGLWRKKRKK